LPQVWRESGLAGSNAVKKKHV